MGFAISRTSTIPKTYNYSSNREQGLCKTLRTACQPRSPRRSCKFHAYFLLKAGFAGGHPAYLARHLVVLYLLCRFLMPFANADERAMHFQRHGHEFGAGNELQYETLADAFMAAPMTLTMRECVRLNRTHRVRLNVANKHFGVAVVVAGIILTFYIVPLHKLIRRGGIANFFVYECARTNI